MLNKLYSLVVLSVINSISYPIPLEFISTSSVRGREQGHIPLRLDLVDAVLLVLVGEAAKLVISAELHAD